MVTESVAWPTVRWPSRREIRAMIMQPKVIITLIIAVTVVVLALIGGVVYLAAHGASTEALTAAIAAPIFGLLASQGAQLRSLSRQVSELRGNGNGNQG